MRLIVGGAYQGKTDYAVKKYSVLKDEILDCETFAERLDNDFLGKIRCINHFHLLLKNTENYEEECKRILRVNPDIIIICDEIGSGIVPIEKSEREWRERVGRAGCFLAEKAESVERIICGMCVRLK